MIIEDRELESRIITKYSHYLQSINPIFSKISFLPDLHRGGVKYKNNENKELIIPKTTISVQISLSFEDIENYNIAFFCGQIYELITNQIKEFFNILFDTLNKITAFTGNITDAKGTQFSFDLILDTLEKLEFDFDENGNPIFPTLIVGAELFEKIKQIKMNSAQKKRFNKIIEEKKKKYYASKCYRRLSYID